MDWRHRQRRRQAFSEIGHAHELTFSCYNRFKFLSADRACQWLADAINLARVKISFQLWAYVFMPEHVHLIIFPNAGDDVSAILKAIKEPVGRVAIQYLITNASQWLPRVTRRRGKRVERLFWESGGGYDRNVNEAKTLCAMIDYIHMNPVRRGLVECSTDWKWSSASWFEGSGGNSLPPDSIPPDWIA